MSESKTEKLGKIVGDIARLSKGDPKKFNEGISKNLKMVLVKRDANGKVIKRIKLKGPIGDFSGALKDFDQIDQIEKALKKKS